MVGTGAYPTLLITIERIVVLRPSHANRRETMANFNTLSGWD